MQARALPSGALLGEPGRPPSCTCAPRPVLTLPLRISHTLASGTPYCLNWIKNKKKNPKPTHTNPSQILCIWPSSFAIFFPGCIMYQRKLIMQLLRVLHV